MQCAKAKVPVWRFSTSESCRHIRSVCSYISTDEVYSFFCLQSQRSTTFVCDIRKDKECSLKNRLHVLEKEELVRQMVGKDTKDLRGDIIHFSSMGCWSW